MQCVRLDARVHASLSYRVIPGHREKDGQRVQN